MENNHKMIAALMSTAFLFVVLAVSATSSGPTSYAPLYTVRMEQTSMKMDFLWTEKNGFTYTAEEGYTLNYSTGGTCDTIEALTFYTCFDTCHRTCRTCYPVCAEYNIDALTYLTCSDTCWRTCHTCYQVCG